MKKFASILSLLLLMLAILQFGIQSHFCQGTIVSSEFIFAHSIADDSMPNECNSCTTTSQHDATEISTPGCCDNQIISIDADNNYITSELKISKPQYHLLQAFYIPQIVNLLSLTSTGSENKNVYTRNAKWHPIEVGQSFICVFLI